MGNPRNHALLSPSKSNIWMSCPGSVQLSLEIPEKESPYAAEGTAAHKLCEKGLNAQVTDISELPLPKDIDGFPITDEMIESTNIYLEAIAADVPNLKKVEAEKRFKLTPNIWGTCDAVYAKNGKVFVWDYKYGKGVVVHPEDNSQMLTYALGALHRRRNVKNIKISIVQPRAYCDRGCVRSVEYTPKALKLFKRALMKAEERIIGMKEPDLKAGSHCRWCKAKAICPEQKRLALAATKTKDFQNLPPPNALSTEEIGKVICAGDTLTSWIKSVGEYAHTLAEKGETIPGCKLVSKRKIRKWVDDTQAAEFITDAVGDSAYERKLLSPAKAEKVLKKEGVEIGETFQSLIHTPETGTKIVSEEKPGKAIETKSTADRFIESDGRFD